MQQLKNSGRIIIEINDDDWSAEAVDWELPPLSLIRMNLSNDITAPMRHRASSFSADPSCVPRSASSAANLEGNISTVSEGERIRHMYKAVKLSMLPLCLPGSFWMAVWMLCPLTLKPSKNRPLFGRTQQDPARRADFD